MTPLLFFHRDIAAVFLQQVILQVIGRPFEMTLNHSSMYVFLSFSPRIVYNELAVTLALASKSRLILSGIAAFHYKIAARSWPGDLPGSWEIYDR